ncbi:CRAL/TRIO domain-containing protein [Metschnikowia bicuspidata]|uniref:CRAL/TRIO domain-containing protein n=1 Tax=Metschnikowia bicuspidata TaxID=27322 RepID=A0A4P9ZBV6_9ASCO|nr:CRAL/TRIO domain-containing protein [Metschnikowia bicuspidata]
MLWRRTFGVVKMEGLTDPEKVLTAAAVENENVTGKTFILGYDLDNRPCLYFRNGYQNTQVSIRQVQHLVFMLERVIDFIPAGQYTLALMIDFKVPPPHLKLSSGFPSLSISKQVLHILQNHYPERLGLGLFTNIPWIGYTFFKPFHLFVPQEQLDKEFNGLLDFEYVHDVYWPNMNELACEKAAIYGRNFEKLGGVIGLSEYDLKQT